uniref:C2H2-type domain-containing protein n=1 Tax=Mola mola TaxID=94237 RepID=A0A3Q3XHM1_MOLML
MVMLCRCAVSVSQTAHQAEPARPHLCHLQQGVQEQLQPAAAPVGAHGHQDEGPGVPRKGGPGEDGPGGQADGPAVPAPAHSAHPALPCPHRRPRDPPPARSARKPREPDCLCVHRPGNRNHGCSASNPNPNPSANTNQVRKNHACEACGKAFRDVYHLNRHRLSHSDEKPYSCPVCQQRFKRKDRMSYHVRSHQGGVEKPYICPHCAKAFSRYERTPTQTLLMVRWETTEP